MYFQGIVLGALIRPAEKKAEVLSSKKFSDSEALLDKATGLDVPYTGQCDQSNKFSEALTTQKHQVNQNKESPPRQSWKHLLHWRIILLAALGYNFGYVMSVYFVSLPYYLENYGITPHVTAQLFMIGAVASIAVRILAAITGN